jgi:predicted MFS family arabinose efflux permease
VGWRTSFFGLALLHAMLMLCLLFFVRERPAGGPAPVAEPRVPALTLAASMKTLFASWNYWAISWSVFFRYGAYAAIQALWAGPFLMDFLGLSAITAGNLLLMINIGFAIGAPSSGVFSDRMLRSRKGAMILGLTVAAGATFTLTQWSRPDLIFLLGVTFFVIGFSNGFGQISYAHIKELMPDEMSGTAMAGINFFTMLGPGIFIHALGDVLQSRLATQAPGGNAYQIAFMICLGAVVAALLFYATTRDTSDVLRPAKRTGT